MRMNSQIYFIFTHNEKYTFYVILILKLCFQYLERLKAEKRNSMNLS